MTPGAGDEASTLDSWLDEHGAGLVATRRHLHAHPELSGREHATTELVRERLTLAGLSPRPLAVGTGLICDVGDAGRGPTIALRADLDALGMSDVKDVPYRSQVEGVAHACGHDVHTTIVLGTALYLAHHRPDLAGRVRCIFQPSEERVPGGAVDVIDDGGLDGVDAAIGVHCEPKLDVGLIGLRPGPISSAADMAVIELTGPGGHTARPELTIDTIAVAARVVTELPQLVAKSLDDPSSVKVVFGAIHGGDAANVIPTTCSLRASVRTPLADVWEQLPAVFEQALANIVGEAGIGCDLHYTKGVPPVVNDERLTDVVRRAATFVFGEAAVTTAPQSWGGDDFAWYTRRVPGSYVRLGVHDPDSGPPLDLHAAQFDVDERSIANGVRLMVATVSEYLSGERAPTSS